MFEINLLPKELRQKKLALPQINVIKTAAYIIGAFLALHIILSAAVGLERYSLKRLTALTARHASDKKKIDSIKSDINILNEKVKLANKIISDRTLWAKILNEISDVIPPNLWLTEISYQAEKSSIIITGNILEKDLDAMTVIGQMVNGWKTSQRIDIESVTKRNISGVEVSEFRLACQLK